MSPSDYKNLGDRQSGDPHVLRVKEKNTVRPLDNMVAGWRQHGIEHPSDGEQFTSVVCPGARLCPLCRKPVDSRGNNYFPISRRFAANVWDYDTRRVMVLIGGPQIFNKFKEVAAVGIEPMSSDWTITKSGKGKSTEYNVIRHDTEPFSATVITPDMLHSIDKYEQPTSPEKIFEILESFGIDYDSLEIPSYTLEEALKFVMPYTKHKGLTIEQLVSQESSYAEWMHGTKLEQGQLGDPVFLALQTVMEDRGLVPPLDDAIAMLPEEPEPGPEIKQETVKTKAPEPSPSSSNMVELVGPGGATVMVPPSAVDPMLLAGYSRKEDLKTEVDANAPMEVIVGGQKVELPRATALSLIEAGTAQPVEDTPPEPEPPKIPLPDEKVGVIIAGVESEMMFVQACQIVESVATAAFADPDVAEAYERSKATEAANKAMDPSPTQPSGTVSSPAETSTPSGDGTGAADSEKPFVCPECGAAYKTKGALTQHANREHKGEEPQPSATPAMSNGSGVLERVKDKVSHAPFARNYTVLMKMFEEETGEKNFANMNEEQLLKLEARVDLELAKETA